ncbi:TetR/AcrR family transcriptional regulator [Solimonas terrae]|uniref:TetR/AcrR family transcriptional regulator n=1 Tax=Solimonas terrae TaxID=1396819 RepID=A0A6M2BKY8_9GAMM|nr:TetR/AcrR family transcriptional regulator [Solimonas terrae]NGY03184.1 TetR/AcrR family transcriptional regulator [Solimonas terrae]
MAKASPAKKVRLSRAEQNAQRSEELLAAAWTMFCQKGYEAVTIDDVAAQAGYSRMPIYSLFGDKQTLFFELWQVSLRRLADQLLAEMNLKGPLRRNLKRLAEMIADGRNTEPDGAGESLFFVVQTIALSRPDLEVRLQALARDVVTRFTEMIRSSTLADGEVLRSDAGTIAAHLIAHINGLSTVQFQTGHGYARSRELIPIFNAIAFKSADE